MELILTLILFFWGLFMVRFPDVVWHLQHFLHVRGGEPTDFYLITTRISGGICMIVAVVCCGILFFG